MEKYMNEIYSIDPVNFLSLKTRPPKKMQNYPSVPSRHSVCHTAAGENGTMPPNGTKCVSRRFEISGPSACRYRGVYHEISKKVWRARIYWRGTHTTIGRFSTAEAAARAHDAAAMYVFGRGLAATNFPSTTSSSATTQLPAFFRDNVKERLRKLRSVVRQDDRAATRAAAVQLVRDAAAYHALNYDRSLPSRATSRQVLMQVLIIAARVAPCYIFRVETPAT